jgi:hypothetical protein
MPVIPGLWKPRQENCEFMASLSYKSRPLKKKKERKEKAKRNSLNHDCKDFFLNYF